MASPNLCCCCSLKTGGMIIAILDIIGGIVVILGSIALFGIGAVVKTRQPSEDLTDHDIAATSILMYFVGAILLVAGVLSIVFGVLLLVAISKRSQYMLKVWIIIRAVLLAITILGFIGEDYNAEEKLVDSNEPLSPGMTAAIHVISNLFFGLWFISVVYYLRKEFLEEGVGNTAPVYFKA